MNEITAININNLLSQKKQQDLADALNISNPMVTSSINAIISKVNSKSGRAAIETAEKFMELYSFQHKFQTQEFINICDQIWSDE